MTTLPLNETEQRLLDLLLAIPPSFNDAQILIQETSLPPESITKAAICYAEECFLDFGDHISAQTLCQAQIPQGIMSRLHSSYILDVVKLLFPYGLDPNAIFKTEYGHHNLMEAVQYVDNAYLAADTMAFLLEHGGDPNMVIDHESIFERVDFEVWFGAVEQEIRWRYDAWVHTWFVLLGYGGGARENEIPVQMFKDYETGEPFDLKKLRNHRDFYYGLSIENKERTVHIYDKKTFWEVARC